MQSLLGDTPEGLIFIVSAPSGTGKTTLIKKLTQQFPSIIASISFTTRLPREGEVSGVNYHFITEAEFKTRIAEGDFLEYVQLYETYYGTSREWIKKQQQQGKHVVLVIDTQGHQLLRGKISATSIFVRPPSLSVLKKRLEDRKTESALSLEERLKRAPQELIDGWQYDYQVVNDDLEVAYEVFRSIFIAETHRSRL